eukprot:1024663-Ditylum_brightwellii.AAC.1
MMAASSHKVGPAGQPAKTAVPPDTRMTHLKHCNAWHNRCDKHKKFVEHHKEKKATTTQLEDMESNTVAGIAVTEDGKMPAIVPHEAIAINWAGLMSILDD